MRKHIRFLLDNLIWVIVIGVGIVFTFLSDPFLTQDNLINILVHASVLGILVVGQTFVLMTGNFDLSSESTLALAAAVAVWLIAPAGTPTWGSGLDIDWWIAVLAVLAMGAAVGAFNGLLITKARVNNFVVTLSMLIILRGAVLLTGDGQTISGASKAFNWLGSASWGIVPISVIVLLATFAVAHVVMRYRTFGRELYAVGGNREAALASGINPDRRIVHAYIISGVLAALAGWVLAGRVQAVPLNLGEGMIFEVFAAAVIGGISLNGGRGSMLGAFGGVLLLAMIDNGLNLLAVDVFWIQTIRGAIILLAVLIDAQKVRFRGPAARRTPAPLASPPAKG